MTIADPVRTHTIDSKEAVLDAAQRLINQYGYEGFSMRDLAQHSGLAKATIYHHFQDKQQILRQVLERDLNFIRDHLTAAANRPGDLPTRLRNVTLEFFELASTRGVLLLSTLRQVAGMEREFCLLMRDYREELHRPIVAMLQEAMAQGTIRALDPELATMSYFGILQVFATRHLIMNDLELDNKAANYIVDFVLNGLLPPPSST